MKFITILSLLVGTMAASTVFADSVSPLTVVTVNGQNIYADSNHLTVYVFDNDKSSDSTCYGGCAQAWPAVLLPPNTSVQAPLGTTVRTDGTTQITLNGKPLYRYIGDAQEGDINGDGLGNVWHLIKAN